MAPLAVELELDAQYRALREGAGLLDRSGRGKLVVAGADAAEYLQGQLTNDVEALAPGEGAYAALLDRKGHIQADMRVLALAGGRLWLDLEPEATEAAREHLRRYSIGRDVEIEDASERWAITSVIGPAAATAAGFEGLGPEHASREAGRGGAEVIGVATDLGVDLLSESDHTDAVRADLLEGEPRAEPVTEEAAEILRVESGRPRFGRELGPETMPAEGGIVERAVDFEKGCYIGQEPVARLHYRGRPNRVLRGLRLSAPVPPGAEIRNEQRELGRVSSPVVSPALGPLALAVLRREADVGDTVRVEGGVEAEVASLPFNG